MSGKIDRSQREQGTAVRLSDADRCPGGSDEVNFGHRRPSLAPSGEVMCNERDGPQVEDMTEGVGRQESSPSRAPDASSAMQPEYHVSMRPGVGGRGSQTRRVGP